METPETIFFTITLLLLIVSLTLNAFIPVDDNDHTNVFTLFSMVLVGLSTPLNIMQERRHKLPKSASRMLVLIFGVLGLLVFMGHF